MVLIGQDGEDIRPKIEGSPYDMRKAGTDRRQGLRRAADLRRLGYKVLGMMILLASTSFALGYLLGGGYLNGLR